MKTGTQNTYQERIQRVVGFLSDHVDDNPSLATLADVAMISPFHFHRVYRATTGETPSGTVRRLRLAKACNQLRDADISIADIAFNVGYDTSQSFAKAFKAMTKFSPSELRQDRQTLDAVLIELSAPAEPIAEATNLEVRLVSVEPFKVIASRHFGPHKGLFQAYGELFNWAEQNGLVEKFQGIYGIPIDDPRDVPESECRFDCCFDFGAESLAEEPFQENALGGGDYAVVRHVGPYDGMETKHDYLYGSWLPNSACELREAPLYNHYLQDPDSVPPEEWETDIYLPVTKLT
jgi:AraC family transcriptional regulator